MAKRIYCWNCEAKFTADADGPCPACGTPNQLQRKLSAGKRLLLLFLYIDAAITLASVIYLAASCG
jgi:hypothetical protein